MNKELGVMLGKIPTEQLVKNLAMRSDVVEIRIGRGEVFEYSVPDKVEGAIKRPATVLIFRQQ